MAHRVYHWRHGWIPLDGTALAEKDHTAALKKVGGYRGATPSGFGIEHTEERVEGAPHVRVVTEKSTEGDDPYTLGHIRFLDQQQGEMTPAQKREAAGHTEEFLQRFPGLHRGLDQEIRAVEPNDDYWAATDPHSRKHGLALSKMMWESPRVREEIANWNTQRHSIAGMSSTQKEFRRRVISHEMAHVMHMKAREQQGRDSMLAHRFARTNSIDEFVNEPVTPREMGYTQAAPGDSLDQKVPRWAADSLDRKSAYGMSNPEEFWAEALVDGMFNGAKASDSGVRALAIANELYGKGAS